MIYIYNPIHMYIIFLKTCIFRSGRLEGYFNPEAPSSRASSPAATPTSKVGADDTQEGSSASQGHVVLIRVPSLKLT